MDKTKYIQYEIPNGLGAVEVVVKDETIWCTQKAMAQIFGVGVPAISKHLNNIYMEGELQKKGNCFQNGNSSGGGNKRG